MGGAFLFLYVCLVTLDMICAFMRECDGLMSCSVLCHCHSKYCGQLS